MVYSAVSTIETNDVGSSRLTVPGQLDDLDTLLNRLSNVVGSLGDRLSRVLGESRDKYADEGDRAMPSGLSELCQQLIVVNVRLETCVQALAHLESRVDL